MAKKKDIIQFWMPSIMIASMMLLTAFVGHWLYSQFSLVQTRVEKDIRSDLRRTSDQLTDTMMLGLMQQPLKDANVQWSAGTTISHTDNNGKKITEIKKIDSLSSGTMINIVVQTDSNVEGKHSYHKIISEKDINGKLKIKTINRHSDKIVMISNRQEIVPDKKEINGLFTKGLGVFIKELASIQNDGDISAITNQKLDTNLYKRILQANWQQSGLSFRPIVRSKNRISNFKDRAFIFAVSPVFNEQIGVSLSNLNTYVFKQLFAQIFFAFFIILITCGGFVFIYRSWKKQVQLNQLRLDFMHNMSHELKTPVSTVKVAIEALQLFNRKNEPKVVDEYLTVIQHEMNRLDTLVNNVLSNAMLQDNQMLLRKEKTDLVALAKKVCDRMDLSLSQAQINHTLQTNKEVIELNLDIFHIEGVITNLLDNCIKYAGANSSVVIDLKNNDSEVILEVRDDGPGISTEYLDQLFTPFFRVPTGNEHAIKGYGLGLSYCNQVIQQHGGKIKVTNCIPKGISFSIHIPKVS